MKNVFDLLTKKFEFACLDEFEQNGYECISYTRVTQSYEDALLLVYSMFPEINIVDLEKELNK